MKVIENKTNFNINEIISIAKRENNNKRKYLIVNRLQAKHIPVSPDKSLNLFDKLGNIVKEKYKNENVIIIGFAETATAIGTEVAKVFGNDTFYITTTREKINEKYKIVDFSEEHSHATEQKLFCKNWENVISNVQRIIFVEDEVSTGKTILNFIKALKSKGINNNIMFSVASIINAMNNENRQIFDNNNIDCSYLLKIDSVDENNNSYLNKVKEQNILKEANNFNIKNITGKKDVRTGVKIKDYIEACRSLVDNIMDEFLADDFDNKTVLVLGTEEFMYPSIKIAERILKMYNPLSVVTHSTTRSPIEAFNDKLYPINSKYSISSMYSKDRKTYIYNLKIYDKVIIITDSDNSNIDCGVLSLYNTFNFVGCNDINFIRWVD